jgi:hypothetical protein
MGKVQYESSHQVDEEKLQSTQKLIESQDQISNFEDLQENE